MYNHHDVKNLGIYIGRTPRVALLCYLRSEAEGPLHPYDLSGSERGYVSPFLIVVRLRKLTIVFSARYHWIPSAPVSA